MSTKKEFQSSEQEKSVIYVAFGYEYLLMALHSAESLVQHNPGVEVVVASNVNQDWLPGLKDYTEKYRYLYLIEATNANRKYKLSVNGLTESDKVIYMDCDTLIAGSLEPLWKALDEADLMALPLLITPSIDALPEEVNSSLRVSYYNGGVVAFKNNERVGRFFRNWLSNYERIGIAADQPSLAYSLNQSDLFFKPISIWFNYLYSKRYKPLLRQSDLQKVAVHHYLHPHFAPDIPPRLLKIHEDIKGSLDKNCPAWFQEDVEIFEPTYRYRSVNIKLPEKLRFYPILQIYNRIVKKYYEKRYSRGRELRLEKERTKLGQ